MSALNIAAGHSRWPDYNAKCDNCGGVWPATELDSIDRLAERLTPGGPVPAGQCPAENCGALCYPVAPVEYSCKKCGGSDVEILYPAWIDANKSKLVLVDYEASPLSCMCNTCGETVVLIHESDTGRQEITGRWD